MRKKIVAGNWKMNKNLSSAIELASGIASRLGERELADHQGVVLCPPHPFLSAVKTAISGSAVRLGAQNCHQKASGAYTGEVSVDMLQSVGVEYVIVGHSERRAYNGEGDELLKAKADAVLASAGLNLIFCCGESLEIREAKKHFDWVKSQLQNALFHLPPDVWNRIVIAYEPIWAIGTGKTASPEQAQEIHAHIRGLLRERYDNELAEATTILYGGSCKPSNAAELFANPDVDGGLIGGAALKADDFIGIIDCMP